MQAPLPPPPSPLGVQGVVKALFEHRLLPRVLAGSSVGSIIASIVATKTDEELGRTLSQMQDVELAFFSNARPVELAHHFINKGHLQVGVAGMCAFCSASWAAWSSAAPSSPALPAVASSSRSSDSLRGRPAAC